MFRAWLSIASVTTHLRVHGHFDRARFEFRFGAYRVPPVDASTGTEGAAAVSGVTVHVEPTGTLLGSDVPHPGLRAFVAPEGIKFIRDDVTLWVPHSGDADVWLRGPVSHPRLGFDVDAGVLDTPLRVTTTLRLLASGRGALAHAAGFAADGDFGIAFLGESGAGKTTTARALPTAGVLSDDQVGLLRGGPGETNRAFIVATPFIGMHGHIAAPRRVPLRAIVLLERNARGRVVRVPRELALGRVLRSIPMYGKAKNVADNAVDFAMHLCATTPVFEGAPDLDGNALEWVESIRRASTDASIA